MASPRVFLRLGTIAATQIFRQRLLSEVYLEFNTSSAHHQLSTTIWLRKQLGIRVKRNKHI